MSPRGFPFSMLGGFAVCALLHVPHVPAASGMEPADAAWSQVISGGEKHPRRAAQDRLSYFMAEVERIDRRRRDLGWEFWRAYPQDARRYQWLLLTVLMPPHYPVSMEQWARNEGNSRFSSGLGVNPAPVDLPALEQWQAAYPSMRAGFLKSPATSIKQRRLLETVDIYQNMRRCKEAQLRGERCNSAAILRDVLEVTAKYPHPVDEIDASLNHRAEFHRLYLMLFERRPKDYFADGKASRDYLDRLAATGNTFAQLYKAGGLTEMSENWPAENWSYIPYAAHENFGDTPEGKIAAKHLLYIQGMKHAGIGRRLWTEIPDHEQRYRWLMDAYGSSAWMFHVDDFASAIRIKALDARGGVAVDEAADREWTEFLDDRLHELVNAKETSNAERAALQEARISSGLTRLVFQGQKPGEDREARGLLAGYIQWYRQFHDEAGFVRTLTVLQRDYKAYGLNDADLRQFVRPLLVYKAPGIRAAAQAILRALELKAIPFELVAKTLDGRPFDLESLRGKIVFLDHWATTCASCLAAMPAYHQVYLDYRSRGVEVISVGYDAVARARRVKRITDEKALTWTTVAADALRQRMSDRYGWVGFPQYSLLNRDGTLHADTADIHGADDLRRLLDGMLAGEASPRPH